MISFNEWDADEIVTTEYAPAEYEELLRQSIYDMNKSSEPELTLMPVETRAIQDPMDNFPIRSGKLMRQPVILPGFYLDL